MMSNMAYNYLVNTIVRNAILINFIKLMSDVFDIQLQF